MACSAHSNDSRTSQSSNIGSCHFCSLAAKAFINPRCACAARVTVSVPVRLSVSYHVFCHHEQEIGQRVIVMGSVLHWLDLIFI